MHGIRNTSLLFAGMFWLVAGSLSAGQPPGEVLHAEVMETERAFARTMAERDFEGFASFLADETVFFAGEKPLEGRQAVMNAWRGFYEAETAPFSWEPGTVVVLESGTLALSTGPVFNPAGEKVATFTSIWRLEAPGSWRIVFDKGCRACNCEQE
ncbi:MAG: nuclear transport factor 2 family protein [Lysobacterales bacterium]|jgi:ketosteroid isomerase-like protein